MKAILFCFWFFLCLGLSAQETGQINGHISSGEAPLEAVTVENISQATNTVTDSTGYFIIKAQVGDTLVFSDKNVVPKRVILTQKEFENLLKVNLQPIVNQLDEALVYSNRNINAVALGIIPKEIKPLTNNEKKLRTAGDFKYIHLLGLLGGSLAVDPLINKISGKTKRLKKTVAAERIAKNYEWLKENYSGFVDKNLTVPEADLGRFLYFLADNEATQALWEQKDRNKLELYIMRNWGVFQKLN